MTKTEAVRAKVVISKDKGVEVTGFRRYNNGKSYAVEVIDLQTRYPFVVYSLEQWMEKKGSC